MRYLILLPFITACSITMPNSRTLPWIDVPLSPMITFTKKDLVLDVGSSFDACHAKYPTIVTVGAEYWMYYSARAKDCFTGSIGLAKSTDGIHWVKYGRVLSWGNKADHPSVIYENGIFKMWLTLQDTIFHIGYSESADGVHWSSPIVLLNGTLHPTVIKVNNEYYMYFNSIDNGKLMLTRAKSADGVHFTLDSGCVFLPEARTGIDELYDYNAGVLDMGGVYHIWYSSVSKSRLDGEHNTSCIVHAISYDLITWTRDDSATLCNSESGYDHYAAFQPFVLRVGNRLLMYYSAGSGAKYRTMLAEANIPN